MGQVMLPPYNAGTEQQPHFGNRVRADACTVAYWLYSPLSIRHYAVYQQLARGNAKALLRKPCGRDPT